jgi:hypothetical protein
LLWSTNFERNSSHIGIFIQVNWLITLLLISLRKASIGGGRNLPLSQDTLWAHTSSWEIKTQNITTKLNSTYQACALSTNPPTCQQTTSMGVAEQTEEATWVPKFGNQPSFLH